MIRELKYYEAVHEAIDICLEKDINVYVLGLGVSDPKGIFGSTLGLCEKYGSSRVMDIPASENGITGIAIGSSLVGMRPIITHQRLDFALLSVEQIVNQAAKWHYMFGGKGNVPVVIRMIIGRGWGQGPQHSQSLQSWFAHIPGLKVIMPTTPEDAKGMLISSVEDNNPVISLEHRWLHNVTGKVPSGIYRTPIGKCQVMSKGSHVTVVATSIMSLESLKAAEVLSQYGIELEVIDVRTLRPLDRETILKSVRKTGRLIVADTGWKEVGFSAEVVSLAAEEAFSHLKIPPRRLTLADSPTPTTAALADHFYPRANNIVYIAREMMGQDPDVNAPSSIQDSIPLDVPDSSFAGPF